MFIYVKYLGFYELFLKKGDSNFPLKMHFLLRLYYEYIPVVIKHYAKGSQNIIEKDSSFSKPKQSSLRDFFPTSL